MSTQATFYSNNGTTEIVCIHSTNKFYIISGNKELTPYGLNNLYAAMKVQAQSERNAQETREQADINTQVRG